ncbi:DUF3500 domain-containing protein [Fodinicola feengrottensis]|uniref:DUF3500 domain-containing protein n=1 Tax=Fodinicola feengrottensis TaxID=435914 RepID=UPI0024430C67|nr:DUF3500 domain-containing protein [Fodinicola feengrottensis]
MRIHQEMGSAAAQLATSLTDAQRAEMCRPLTDEDLRRDWTYVPADRAGLTFADLNRAQRKGVHRLLATALSPHAYAQAASIMALEDVLDLREGGARGRHNTDYWTVFFGDPQKDDAWGWRFEGHHVSVNVTVVGDQVAVSPCFLGSNPAVIDYRGTAVIAPLTQEAQLPRELLAAMGADCRSTAIVADAAPWDIRTSDSPRVGGAAAIEPVGVSGAKLPGAAAELLRRLVDLYVDRLPAVLAADRRPDLNELQFAWEGPLEPGQGHYYRLQAPNFLVEYDNTQNDANHIHSVCRFPTADFGDDILAAHYATHDH